MCTVTIVTALQAVSGSTARFPEGHSDRIVRMVCNRDELRTRPAARTPMKRICGSVSAVMPVDPVSDGTWIGGNDAGLIMTLLNVYRADTHRSPGHSFRSRGEIIPNLLRHSLLADASESARELDPRDYPPFRLVIADTHQAMDLLSDGRAIRSRDASIGADPILYTSSGLGDDFVEPPRRELFDRLFRECDDPFGVQDEFHAHSWPDNRHLSVAMSRAEARTVSRTVVELSASQIRMTYTPITEDSAEPAREIHLPRRKAVLCR